MTLAITGKKGRKMLLASLTFLLFILIFTLFSINARAVGIPTVTISIDQYNPTCILINATYNDTVTVPSSAGCGGVTCGTDLACCNPKLTDANSNSYNLSTTIINNGKTYLSRRCGLMPGVYDYNITGFYTDGLTGRGGITFQMITPDPALCGNRILNIGEECDDGNKVDGDGCDRLCRQERCNNGRLDAGEECDGNNYANQNCTSLYPRSHCGNLACDPIRCEFITTGCGCWEPNFCGDGTVEPSRGEQCDFGPGVFNIPVTMMRCSDINSEFSGGNLACRNCTINTTACLGAPIGGSCPDTFVEADEQCEGSDLDGKSCATFNFTGGPLTCNSAKCLFDVSQCTRIDPFCGDGTINPPDEVCDGTNLGNNNYCSDLGMCGTTLACNPDDCHYDTSACYDCPDLCGVSPFSIDPNEECDGTNLPSGASCPRGYEGTVGCDIDCNLDYGGCYPISNPCGNGQLDPGEQCEYLPTRDSILCSQINPYLSGTTRLQCTNNCTYNTSSCIGNSGGHCGTPFVIERGEQCEGTNTYDRTCATFNFTNGTLACNPLTCQFNTSMCNNPPPWCGDGKKNVLGESCDGSDLGGLACHNYTSPAQFAGGTLGCTGDCDYDTSACEPIPDPTCNNGQMNPGEECDGNILNGQVCPYGGPISCTNNCQFNYSACNPPPPNHCGDGKVDPCEECDEGPTGGDVSLRCSELNSAFTPNRGRLRCNARGTPNQCMFNTSLCWGSIGGVCGDPVYPTVVPGEQCEGSDINGKSCSDFGTFTTGSLTCNASTCTFNTCHCGGVPPYCGDNSRNNASESCDGPDLDDQTCESRGFASGILDCLPNCHFDTTRCVPPAPHCGNGLIDGDQGEDCEGGNLNGMDCESLGFLPSNDLFCNPPEISNQCKFNTSNCVPRPDFCGDGIVQAGEQCEPRNQDIPIGIGNVTCRNISSSFTGGTLRCNSRCMLNTSSCTGPTSYSCGGDTTVGRGEQCEGTNASGRTCRMINPDFFTGGTLSCTNCILNTSDCITDPVCGDGRRDVSLGEMCDGNDLGGLKCSNFSEYIGGTLGCYGDNAGNNACTFNFGLCTPIVNPDCGNGIINSGEVCDGNAMPDVSCPWTGTVSCADNCTIDYSDCDPPPDYCGDGTLQPGEQCEPPNSLILHNATSVKCHNISDSFSPAAPIGNNNALRCGSRCLYNTSLCIGPTSYSCGSENPVTVGRGEQCEGTNISGRTCTMINPYFTTGTLSCTNCMYNTSRCSSPDPICGDNLIQKPNSDGKIEECDGANLGGYTCNNFPGFEGGTLGCSDCNWDTSGCAAEPSCGDGIIQPQNGEICEPTNLNGMDCNYLQFGGGVLGCDPTTCWFDTSQCNPPNVYCGNGLVESCEQCDSGINSQSSSISCLSFGFGTGTLSCTKNCTINTTSCSGGVLQGYCSNNVLNRGEQCDRTLQEGIRCSNFSIAFISGGVSCNISKCTSNTCECVTGQRGSYCGDGAVQNPNSEGVAEECDGTNTDGDTCESLGYESGTIGCTGACILNTSRCVQGSYCGDRQVQTPNFAGFMEECDSGVGTMTCQREFGSRSTGRVNCTNTCLFDFSNCTNIPEPVCGDNRRDSTRGEDCDGTDFDGQTCITQGYDLGTLMCNAPDEVNPCKFNKSDCRHETEYCGDHVLQRGEQCDGGIGGVTCADFGFTPGEGSLSCNPVGASNSCMFNTSRCVGPSGGWCGNPGNVMERGEQCDATIKGDITCRDMGFMDGSLSCENCMINTNACNPIPQRGYCGDGDAQHPNGVGTDEQCDLNDVEGNTCVSRGYYRGTLRCLGDCSFDYSNCSGPPPTCGDGRRNIELGEDCDLGDLGGETCESFAYIGGLLTCNSTCEYNKSNCQEDPNRPRCGDSVVQKPNAREFMEDCDGDNLDDKSCSDFPAYDGGVLSCDGDCTFDYTQCTPKNDFCGNYVVDPCEECDRGDYGGDILPSVMTCSRVSRSFTSGTLRCTADCKFNTSACNGIGGGVCSGVSGPNTYVNEGESCDGSIGVLRCTNISSNFNSGDLTCDPLTCHFNTCGCNVGDALPVCGDGAINQNSEECDLQDKDGQTCISLGYVSGTLGCYNNCTFNKTRCVPPEEKRCGDGIIQKPNDANFNESCDTNTIPSGMTCSSFPIYNRGILRCLGDCNFDYGNCSGPILPRCGDNIRHTSLGESCDGSDLAGLNCGSLGLGCSGTLLCNDTCGLDQSGCFCDPNVPRCGDSVVQKPNSVPFMEDCDGDNLDGKSCSSFPSYDGGVLSCDSDCTFDYTDCDLKDDFCGNYVVDSCEDCDVGPNGGVIPNNVMRCSNISSRFTAGVSGSTLRCTSDCKFNTSGCIGVGSGSCGGVPSSTAVVNVGESCDGGVGSLTCSDISSAFNGGTLTCDLSTCQFNTCGCTVGDPLPVCGDGVINQESEECDLLELGSKTCQSPFGYLRGTLRCNPPGTANECKLNTSQCVPGQDPYCGDNIIQAPNGAGFNEECEGTNMNGRTCTNFEGSTYTGGIMRCHTDCSYNYDYCTKPTPDECGDNTKNQLSEDCDDPDLAGHSCISQGFAGGILGCDDECKFDKTGCTPLGDLGYCRDGIVQAPNRGNFNEQCDGTNLNNTRCQDLDDYTGGPLSCRSDCTFNVALCTGPQQPICNDRVINRDVEECDVNDFGGMTCELLGFVRGDLSCTNACKIDTSDCDLPTIYCGDHVLQRGEQCDGGIGGVTCADFGFTPGEGSLSCNPVGASNSCMFNTSRCVGPSGGWCGNPGNVMERGEQCDATIKGDITCRDMGFMDGSLSCENCMINTSECNPAPQRGYCGDGDAQHPNGVDMNESCDGNDLDGKTCRSFLPTYTGGTLRCAGDCSFDYGECTEAIRRCGDGVINQDNEECDTNDLDSLTCMSLGFERGTLRCNPANTINPCTLNTSLCIPPAEDTYCGDNIVQRPNDADMNESCDGNALNGRTCANSGYRTGTLTCNTDCSFDYSGCTNCGNGIKNPGEECDGNAFDGLTCRSLGYLGGNLRCTSGCTLDKSYCENNTDTLFCGDVEVQNPNDAGFGEQCDGSNLNFTQCSDVDEYTGGFLSCYGDCTFNHSRCTGGPGPVCNNNVKDFGEECDGVDLGGETCWTLGYAIGTLRCTDNCKLDTTSCRSVINYCGDRIVQAGEQCDGSVGGVVCADFGFTGGGILSCSRCMFNTSACIGPGQGWCGDDGISSGEQCDGVLGSMTCRDFGFMSGDLRCVDCNYNTSGCVPVPQRGFCGDEDTQQPNGADMNESCDGDDLNGRNCRSFLPTYTGGTLSCSGDCNFNFDSCTGPEPPACGDGVVNQPGEDCDENALNGKTCISLGYVRGNLACNSSCGYDKSGCVPSVDPYCGDSIIQTPNSAGFNEQCDGTRLNGESCLTLGDYSGGTLRCAGDCTFDYSRCTGPLPTCGDNVKNQLIEDCDDIDLNGETCQSLGYAIGELSCADNCRFNRTACRSIVNFCGDRFVQAGEQCDGSVGNLTCTDFGFDSGSLKCTRCAYDTSGCEGPQEGWCGDGTVAVGEQCEGSVGVITCRNFGLIDGNLRCTNCTYNTTGCITPPRKGYCGDSSVQQPNDGGFNEQCDSANLNGRVCNTLGLGFTGGTLACAGDCTFDYSGCIKCGDGIKNQMSEECDGSDLDTRTCASLGYESGTLSCTSACKFDTSDCEPPIIITPKYCGDRQVQKPNDGGFEEQCDSTNLDGKICSSIEPYTSGILRCRNDCTYDYTECRGPTPVCGDNVKNRLVESCDGDDLNGRTCVTQGFESGTLDCTDSCAFDTSGCVPYVNFCGNWLVEAGEQCDNRIGDVTCADFGFTAGMGTLSCTNKCVYNTSKCEGATGGYCGDPYVEEGEQCEENIPFDMTCRDFGFMSGNLGCSRCILNTSNCIPAPSRGYCGDNRVQQPNGANMNESCDGSNLNNRICTSFPLYNGGFLACAGDCSFDYEGCSVRQVVASCGDSTIQTPNAAGLNEQCDGASLGGNACSSFPPYTSGTLRCSGVCSFDFSTCSGPTPICGDNNKNRLSEECDGSDLGSSSCASLGYADGALSCTDTCRLDKAGCIAGPGTHCGDGSIQRPNDAGFVEQCDGSSLNGKTCTSFPGYRGGTLACSGDCTYDYGACINNTSPTCGDGVKNRLAEDCDGTDLAGHTCVSQGYSSGTLRCVGCKFDKSDCSNSPGTYCGDGATQQPNSDRVNEDCDGFDFNGASCETLGYLTGSLDCTSGCRFDRSGCSNVRPTYCGDNIIQKPNSAGLNESCEGSNVNNRVCTQFDSYLNGILGCHGDCSFNYDNCNSTIPPRCGDGAKNQYTEECDAGDFGVTTCLSLGFINGSLRCTSGVGSNACKLDTSGCVPPLNLCGDRIVQPGEQCDGGTGNVSCRTFGFTGGGNIYCRNCSYDTSSCTGGSGGYCGDPAIVPGEQCEATISSSISCRTFGLMDGAVSCVGCKFNTSNCAAPSSQGYCGDGGVQRPNGAGFAEVCDGDNLDGKRCSDVGNYNVGTLRCNNDCTFDYSNCSITRVVTVCGDGSIQTPNSAGSNEQCDGTNLNSKSCTSFSNYTTGTLRCNGDCSFDYAGCSGIGLTPKCGDGVKNLLPEECDGNDFGSQTCESLGYAGGTLSCTNGCKLNKAGCISGPATYCGDTAVQQPNGAGFIEQCDGSSLNGKICTSFPGYNGGALACRGDCSYDYTGCTNIATLRCGDSVKNRLTEDCDSTDLAGHTCRSQGYLGGTLSCTNLCKFDKSKCTSAPSNSCGDSVTQQPNSAGVIEECDNADFNGETCQSLGYLGGNLRCTSCRLDKNGCTIRNDSTASCGDGTVQAPNKANFFEQCDGSNLNNLVCSNFDSYTGGNLVCNGDCSRDYRGCTGGTFSCGDGIRNNLTNEECDGTDFGGQSCQTLGYLSGTLGCTSSCKLIKSGCEAAPTTYCGDSIIQTPNSAGFNEQCDRTNLNGNSCDDLGDYTGGTLRCYTGCSYDYSRCTGAEPKCGDGVKNHDDEECDANDFGGLSCRYLGYASGNLRCTNSCKLDKSSCVRGNGTYCGDSSVQAPNSAHFNEQCDNTNLNGKNCTSFDYAGGKLSCAGDCTFSYSNCTSDTKGLCGDGVKNGLEICDKNDWGMIAGCDSFPAFKGGILSCLDSCHFNTSRCIPLNGTVLPVNASCYNNEKDDDETDLDCGGSCFPCADGKACLQGSDCLSNNCKNSVCEGASCEDGIKNGIESDSDCGGNCPQCLAGQGCGIDSDCITTFCNYETLLCTIPACDDGFLNGDESDLDCGGGCAVKCSVGQKCRASYDCQSGLCEAGLCGQDRNMDSDEDGMPDFWEDKYGLNKYDPSDANEDLDGDGYTNLQEFNMQSDPTDANSPQSPGRFKNHTLQIILLIIGILIMLGSAGFLVYSRKVLIPQQNAAAKKKIITPQNAQRPLQKPLSKSTQPGSQSTQAPGRLVKKEGERKSLLGSLGFGKAKAEEKSEEKAGEKTRDATGAKIETKPGAKLETKAKPSDETEKSDDFIELSEIGKTAVKKGESGQPKADKKPSGDIFKRLRELIASRKKK